MNASVPLLVVALLLLGGCDDGGRFTMALGTTTTLRVQDPTAADPVRAVASGTTTVTGHDPDHVLTIVVAPHT